MKQTALGIDIGGTFTKFGLSDIDGNILMEGSIPTYTHKEIKDFMDALSEAIKENLDKILEPIDIMGIGIGAPNGNYYGSAIEYAPNLHWKGVIPFIDLFQSILTYQ